MMSASIKTSKQFVQRFMFYYEEIEQSNKNLKMDKMNGLSYSVHIDTEILPMQNLFRAIVSRKNHEFLGPVANTRGCQDKLLRQCDVTKTELISSDSLRGYVKYSTRFSHYPVTCTQGAFIVKIARETSFFAQLV